MSSMYLVGLKKFPMNCVMWFVKLLDFQNALNWLRSRRCSEECTLKNTKDVRLVEFLCPLIYYTYSSLAASVVLTVTKQTLTCQGEKLEVLDAVTDQHWWRARNSLGQVGMIPESYVRKDGVEVREWFHNIESRPQVEEMLKEHGKDCTYLVRPSARGKVKYSISIFYMGQVSGSNGAQ